MSTLTCVSADYMSKESDNPNDYSCTAGQISLRANFFWSIVSFCKSKVLWCASTHNKPFQAYSDVPE